MSSNSNPDNIPLALFFLASREFYRKKILSECEIFCGPDTETWMAAGRLASLKTPDGGYDAWNFFSQNAVRELATAPELILVKADATGRNFPRNLGKFGCPKVLLVGDTHHMQAPIRKLIEYAKSESFDRIIFDHTRHHARWFFEAGFKNLHWIPALDFTFHQREISARPSRKLTFVGQAGRFHPYRCDVLEKLKRAGLPVEVMQTTPSGAADVYADSLITVNIALNGDLNLRVFEALSAGGFLLTDRLTDSSGLEALFTPGEDLEVWSGTEELVQKIRYYLANPVEAFRIRRAGQKKLMGLHSPEVKIREFWNLVLHGKENPVYSLEAERNAVCQVSVGSPITLLPAYEIFQELHRNRSKLVFYCAKVDRDWVRRFVDLPRVECRLHEEWGPEHGEEGNFPQERILHIGDTLDAVALENLMAKCQPRYVFAPHKEPEALGGWGYSRKEAGVYEHNRPVRGIVRLTRAMTPETARALLLECVDMCINDMEALDVADACDALGLVEPRRSALLRAVFLNRDCFSALVQLADLSLEAESFVDAALLLSEANRVMSLPDSIRPVFEELLEKLADAPALKSYRQALAGGDHPVPEKKRRILVVTNLFPPQELGGYGRKLWEFSSGLLSRGHEILVLTSDSKYLSKPADESEMELESKVRRLLQLYGKWSDGSLSLIPSPIEQIRIIEHNARTVLKAAADFQPDFVLLGNLDLMGVELVKKLIGKGLPVLHSLGNQTPGYNQQDCITSRIYTIATASKWLGENLIKQGYHAHRLETVYPGGRIDRFYKHFLPDCRRLRISYGSLLMPYKGPQVLVHALVILHQAGVDFEAEIAGDTTDQAFVDSLKKIVADYGMSEKVRFIGYLGRKELAGLFARSNVLVFPSQFDEPFGITQVEAMASGLIVVTSGKGGTREIIEHGVNGLVFDASSPESLAKNLLSIAINEELRLQLQRKARERAIELSVVASVAKLEGIAETMLSGQAEDGFDKIANPTQADPVNHSLTRISSNSPMASLKIADAQMAFKEGRLSESEDICREILGKDERCAEAWDLMGKMAALQGDIEAASEFATVAVELDSRNLEFIRNLAEVFLQKKDLELAELHARQALEILPNSPEGLVQLGRILAEKENKHLALEAFQEAVRLRKDYAEGFSQYAMALQKFGRGKDAISQIRKACALAPGSVEFQTNLAILLEQNARYMDALAAYGKAARMNPNVGFVWFRQGKLLNGLMRYTEAVQVLEKAISLPGSTGSYYYEYGVALHKTNRFQDALTQYEKALEMGCNTASLHCNRGVIYKDFRRGGDAVMAFYNAVKLDPTNPSFINNLGAAAFEIGLNSEALECFEQAVEKNPNLPTARNNIGNLLKDRARGMDALPQYKKSMELNPDDRDPQNNYLLCHMYIPDMDPKVVFEEHKKWGVKTAKKLPAAFKFKPRVPGSKIRVGFLSADLCHHPVAHFIEPIFKEYDRERFEFVAYGDQRKSDEYSARFAKQVDLWRETSSYNEQGLAKLIHDDRVDILFELAGHTAYNRLGVFALKPAPVQVSYLGYPGTTGLPTIDFRITDEFADPQGTTEHLHTEKLIRVPVCAWCFQPDAAAPEVESLPAWKNGYITFGCFNNMAKLNPALFETWAEILNRVPGSHLRLKARTLIDDGVRKELKAYFTNRGIEEERLDFYGHTKKIADHLGHYNAVDIALDSFPYHGTTTTCEAMWMGCPVVTRAGKTHVSRVGVSLLNAVGLQECITNTRENYISKALDLASATDRLVAMRLGMRNRLKSSPLMDAKAFARNFETALDEIAAAL